MRISLLLLLIITSLNCNSQNSRKLLYGIVKDSVGELPSVHIINLQTNQGTFTNDLGKFRILGKEGDKLKLSFVGYKTTIIELKDLNFGMNSNIFQLQKEQEVLDEVVIKKTNLTGFLALDLKKVPNDHADELTKNLLSAIAEMDFSTPYIEKIDEIDRSKAPIVKTNPVVDGATLLSFSVFKAKKRKITQNKINSINHKERVYKTLFVEINKKHFTNNLSIPQENIYHFIDYCNFNKVEKMLSEKKILELLRLFEQESIAYLENLK